MHSAFKSDLKLTLHLLLLRLNVLCMKAYGVITECE